MIFVTEGAESPYYAGLILILLAVTAVVHWTTWESLLSVSLVLFMYLAACTPWDMQGDSGIFFNNTYFLFLTGIIVVTGNYLFNQLHFREFALRFELDQNRQKLEENNRRLIELDQVKNRFFANVSHELRTPLTLLLAPLESLLQCGKAKFDGETRELLATMQANSMRLLKLINDLLDLVRMESGRMAVKRESLAVEEFIRGLVNEVRKTAEDKKIRLETTVDQRVGTVLADSDKLEKILLNLIFNALKFTPAGGTIRVTADRQDGELVFRVKDTGVGISGQKLPFIFDRFWQGDTSAQRQYQGVGIGLALVKELVEVQGGKVEVESRVEEGTQIAVRFPYVEAKSNAAATPAKSLEELMSPQAVTPAGDGNTEKWLKDLYRRAELFPSMSPRQDTPRTEEVVCNNGRPRVLIAEDEADMLRFLKSQLKEQFQVLEAVDGQQAIEKAGQFLPDIILCDMMMPVKDGVEVCRELRRRTPTQSIPIVLLTAWADDETKLKALSAGASDFLTKPFSTMELNVRLTNLLNAYHLQRELVRQNQMLEATLEQLKETESQLVHSEKLASLGRMSAGIIHEINNPLNFAKTGLYTLQNLSKVVAGEKETDFKEILKDVEDGIARVQNIVSELHTFTQPNAGQVEDVAVVKLVRSALRLLGNEWRDKLRIVQHISEEQTVSANRNQVTQVLVNLLQNAFYAVTNKQFLKDEPIIWIESCCENGESRIVIRDNGEGIAPENLNKIFDPFFTTKDVGQGMGLGLSVCYRIMEQHGGQIRVKSEKDRYSEFVLVFPVQKKPCNRNG
jgi:signal transduction histidine kinase